MSKSCTRLARLPSYVLQAGLFLVLSLAIAEPARAEMPPQPIEGASLVVEGVVHEAFHSVRGTTIDYVYLIEVRSAKWGNRPELADDGPLPKPGEVIYVHAFQRTADAPRVPGPVGYRQLPTERSVITAYLYPRGVGSVGWQFAYPVGFVRKGTAEDGPLTVFEPERPAAQVRPALPPARQLGILVVPITSNGQNGLQISRVTPGGPAAATGLKPGDIILSANEVPTRVVGDLTGQVAVSALTVRLSVQRSGAGQPEQLDVDLDARD